MVAHVVGQDVSELVGGQVAKRSLSFPMALDEMLHSPKLFGEAMPGPPQSPAHSKTNDAALALSGPSPASQTCISETDIARDTPLFGHLCNILPQRELGHPTRNCFHLASDVKVQPNYTAGGIDSQSWAGIPADFAVRNSRIANQSCLEP